MKDTTKREKALVRLARIRNAARVREDALRARADEACAVSNYHQTEREIWERAFFAALTGFCANPDPLVRCKQHERARNVAWCALGEWRAARKPAVSE